MKLFAAASTLLSLSALIANGNRAAGQEPNRSPAPKNRALISVERPAESAQALAADPARTDFFGDPLPRGAIARLGTLRDNIGEMCSDDVLSPDGKIVTATSTFFAIPLKLWDTATGRVVLELKELDPSHTHVANVQSAAFSPDGKLLAAGDSVGTVRIGRTDTGRKVREITGPEVAFALDGKSLAACDERGLRIVEVTTGREIGRIDKVRAPIRSLCVAPDGKSLAGIDDRGVCFWDVATGRERASSPHVGAQALAFAPIGHRLATGEVTVVRLWDTETGHMLMQFRAEKPLSPDNDSFDSVAFAPDGTILAAGFGDGAVRLWDAATGELRGRLEGVAGFASGLKFAPDGKSLATTAVNGTTLIWAVPIARKP